MPNEIRIIVRAEDQTGPAFAKAKAETAKLSNDIASEMEKAGKRGGLGLAGGIGDGGRKAGMGFVSGFGNTISDGIQQISGKLNPQMVLLGAGAVAALSPVIGAGLSMAVIGGVGIGGVVGGALLAAKDPRVSDAGKSLGQKMFSGLKEDSAVFVAPMLASIDKIGNSFQTRLRPMISSVFKDSAGFVAPLTDGVLRGVEHITAGIASISSKAQPVMESLGGLFEKVGRGVGDMMHIISGGSDETAKFIDDLAGGLETVTRNIGFTIRGLTEVYGFIHDGVAGIGEFIGVTGQAEEMTGTLERRMITAGTAAVGMSEGLAELKHAAIGADGPIYTLTDDINSFSKAGRSAFSAATNMGAALDDASAALKKNGKTLDENTEKGRANRTALARVADAAIAVYNAEVQRNGEGPRSNAIASSNRASFIRLATAMTGSAEKARTLANELGLIPGRKEIRLITIDQATAKARSIQRTINAMRGKTIPITVRVTRQGETLYGNQAPQMAHGGIKGAASGATSSGLTWVGEQGPELLQLPAGTSVKTAGDSKRMAMQGAGMGGGKVEVLLRFDPSGAPEAIAGLMEGLRGEIRAQGGNVQVALGQPGRE